MLFDQDIPVILRSEGAAVNVVVTNIMACRVYGRTKFSQVLENELSMELETRRRSAVLAFAHPSIALPPTLAHHICLKFLETAWIASKMPQ